MSKKRNKKQQPRSTNWTVILGISLAGVVGLLFLLALSLRTEERITLEERCQENPELCVATGSADAEVTLLEVLDFGCPHCRDFHVSTMKRLEAEYVDAGQLQVIYYPYALSNNTLGATSASLCANEQDAYLEYIDAVFASFDTPDNLTSTGLLRSAANVGLDLDSFGSCMESGRHIDTITENVQAAQQMQVTSTPTFFINGVKMNGNRPFQQFQDQINNILN